MSKKKKLKNNKKTKVDYVVQQDLHDLVYTSDDVLSMMNDTSKIIQEENSTRLSSIGASVNESNSITDNVEFWSWMNRNYEKSGHFSSAERMQSLVSGTPGQQNWAKKIAQGKGYEWDWMTSQRRSFKNLFKIYDAGDVANRPGSDITAHDILSGADKDYQLKAYTSKNTPHLTNTPKDMAVVTNAEKVEDVTKLGYKEVLSYEDNTKIEQARTKRLDDMATGASAPTYNIKNVGLVTAKAGILGFVISASVETIASYKKWKNGDISTLEYLKEIMTSGGNTGVTASFSTAIMIPVTAAITTAGVSSLITYPISFVVTASVDKVVAPAFARGDYKKIVNEATYYHSMIDFSRSLASIMENSAEQYSAFVSQMISEQQQFNELEDNVISQQAIDDFNYYASLPSQEINGVVTGMITLLNNTDEMYENLKNQNWFNRMLKTVIGKNKATKEDIHKNYERLGIYVSKAVEILYSRQLVDEKVLVIYGKQIIALRKDNIALASRVESLESWKNSVNQLLLATNSESNNQTAPIKQLVDENTLKASKEAEKLFLSGKLIDAFPLFKDAANNGDGRSCYYLGEYFMNGYGHIKENEDNALEYWRKGMEIGDCLSTYQYGLLKYENDVNQRTNWIHKHINSVLRLANAKDSAALYVLGQHIINDCKDPEDLGSLLGSVADSLKYFKGTAENGYWPGAFMFYKATEEIRRSGTWIPNYNNLFVDVEWYQTHFMYGMFEVLCGSQNFDECARHFQNALWLRNDKTESAGFIAFLLSTGLVKDSISNGYTKANISIYYETGLKSNDENVLSQIGILYFTGIGHDGMNDSNNAGLGRNHKKAYEYLMKSYLIFKDKTKRNEQVNLAMFGIVSGTIGSLLIIGEGIPQNYDSAIQYLKMGHELKDPQSIYMLAACYKEGFGVKQDLTMADKLMNEIYSMHLQGFDGLTL